MNSKMLPISLMLLFTLGLSSCAGYAVYGYPDYPSYYDYGDYPHGYVFFHHDFDYSHHFHGGHHEARHWGGRH